MPRIVEITDIPADKINMVENSYRGDKATTERVETDDNTFTLIATFPKQAGPKETKAYAGD